MEKIVILNWKHQWVKEWAEFVRLLLEYPQIYLAPPLPLVGLCAQNVPGAILSPGLTCHAIGSFTGAYGPEYLKCLGVSKILLGHKEQRVHTSLALLKEQILLALECQIEIYFCLGEEHQENWIEELQNDIDFLHSCCHTGRCHIIYEPLWAVGSDLSISLLDLEKRILYIKKMFSRSGDVFYGGNVQLEHLDHMLASLDIRGVILGRASLNYQKFSQYLEHSKIFCARGDSNPHGLRHSALNAACLPIPPLSL